MTIWIPYAGDDEDDELLRELKEPACRVCGCTDNYACEGGCSWVIDDPGELPICSACVPPHSSQLTAHSSP